MSSNPRLNIAKDVRGGNVGKDPEFRMTPSGVGICEFSVASSYKKGEEYLTVWSNVKCFNKTAEYVMQHVKKGDVVYVEGVHRVDSWEDVAGHKMYKEYTIADSVNVVWTRNGASMADDSERGTAQTPGRPVSDSVDDSKKQQSAASGDDSGELPF